jgi:hypothetical protein
MQSMQQTNQPINQPTNQPTNQPNNKQTDKKKNKSLPIYIQYAGIHMTKVFFSKDFLPNWSLLLPVMTTKVTEHIRISTFP